MGIFQYNKKVEVVEEVVEPTKTEPIVDTKDSKIEFKGTLSEVYTQALNEAYALESVSGDIDYNTSDDNDKAIHVHTYSTDELNDVHKVIKEVHDSLLECEDDLHLIGLESSDTVKSNILKSYLEKDLKVKVLIGQESILKGVLELRKKS